MGLEKKSGIIIYRLLKSLHTCVVVVLELPSTIQEVWTFLLPRQFLHFTPPRCSTSRSGNTPGRVKRVVSCKRKTHHLTMARRKQPGSVRMHGVAKKDDETSRVQNMQQETFCMDPLEFPPYVSHNDRAGRTGPEHADYSTITEVRDVAITDEILFLDPLPVLFVIYWIWMFCSSQRIIGQWQTCCLGDTCGSEWL